MPTITQLYSAPMYFSGRRKIWTRQKLIPISQKHMKAKKHGNSIGYTEIYCKFYSWQFRITHKTYVPANTQTQSVSVSQWICGPFLPRSSANLFCSFCCSSLRLAAPVACFLAAETCRSPDRLRFFLFDAPEMQIWFHIIYAPVVLHRFIPNQLLTRANNNRLHTLYSIVVE